MGKFTPHTYTHAELNWDSKLVPLGGGDSDLDRIAAAFRATDLGSGIDWNTVTDTGSYLAYSATNAPRNFGDYHYVEVLSVNPSSVVQIAYHLTSGYVGRRLYVSGAWGAWDQVVTASMIQSVIGDTGWVTSSTGITAASGWTLNSSKYRIRNGLAEVGVNVTKNATAVTAGSNGSITNTPLVNLPALLVPTSANGTVSNVGATSTFSAQGYFSQSASQIVLTMANGGIPAGGVFDGYGFCYL